MHQPNTKYILENENNFSFCPSFSRWGRKIILSPHHGFTKTSLFRNQSSLACDNQTLKCLITEISSFCCASVFKCWWIFPPHTTAFLSKENLPLSHLKACKENFKSSSWHPRALFLEQCSVSHHPNCRNVNCKAFVPQPRYPECWAVSTVTE